MYRYGSIQERIKVCLLTMSMLMQCLCIRSSVSSMMTIEDKKDETSLMCKGM